MPTLIFVSVLVYKALNMNIYMYIYLTRGSQPVVQILDKYYLNFMNNFYEAREVVISLGSHS